MSQRSEDSSPGDANGSHGSGLRDSVEVFGSHEEARADEIARQAKLSPFERMKQFMELQRRVWGTDNPDVRESGAVHIERRDD